MRRHGKPKAPFKSLLTDDKKQQLHRKTAAKHFQVLTSALNWWVAEGHLETSPAGQLGITVPKGKKDKARRPFTALELKKLFTSPMYTGCKNAQMRMRPGPNLIRDGYYWVPMVGVLSGMRLGEIVQLGLKDVDVEAGIPVFRVRADDETGGTVKSDAGWRDVPIHRRLIELGFLKFVQKRQAGKKNRIFADFARARAGPLPSFHSPAATIQTL